MPFCGDNVTVIIIIIIIFNDNATIRFWAQRVLTVLCLPTCQPSLHQVYLLQSNPCQLSPLTSLLPVNMSFLSLAIPCSHLGIATLSVSLQNNFCSEVLSSRRAVSAWGHYSRKWQTTLLCHSLESSFFRKIDVSLTLPQNESWFI